MAETCSASGRSDHGSAGRAHIGFVLDDRVASLRHILARRCGPLSILRGCPTSSPSCVMRYGWIADEINNRPESGLHYELYRPWRRYAAVVFVKSMGDESRRLAARLRRRGVRVVFDANVDYYTRSSGTVHYEQMALSDRQRRDAVAMTGMADAVIADSEHLARVCRGHNPNVTCIPDNVRMELVPPALAWPREAKLRVLWSGEAVKLFELLLIEDVLAGLADKIRLVLVTSDLGALKRWAAGYRERFARLTEKVQTEIRTFTSIEELFSIYAQGGVAISPRFLDNPYNLGHTEWKITLAMACGRPVLCSPQPSYVTVAGLAGGQGVTVCSDSSQWRRAFDRAIAGETDLEAAGLNAQRVVREHYATGVIAERHAAFMRQVIGPVSRRDAAATGERESNP